MDSECWLPSHRKNTRSSFWDLNTGILRDFSSRPTVLLLMEYSTRALEEKKENHVSLSFSDVFMFFNPLAFKSCWWSIFSKTMFVIRLLLRPPNIKRAGRELKSEWWRPGLPGGCNWKKPNSVVKKAKFWILLNKLLEKKGQTLNKRRLEKKANYLINSQKFRGQTLKKGQIWPRKGQPGNPVMNYQRLPILNSHAR